LSSLVAAALAGNSDMSCRRRGLVCELIDDAACAWQRYKTDGAAAPGESRRAMSRDEVLDGCIPILRDSHSPPRLRFCLPGATRPRFSFPSVVDLADSRAHHHHQLPSRIPDQQVAIWSRLRSRATAARPHNYITTPPSTDSQSAKSIVLAHQALATTTARHTAP